MLTSWIDDLYDRINDARERILELETALENIRGKCAMSISHGVKSNFVDEVYKEARKALGKEE
jgi:hypothetical protein